MDMKQKTPSQWLWVAVIAVLTIVLAVGLLWNNKTKTSETAAQGEQEHAHQENEKDEPKQDEKDEKHETEESLSLTAEQMQQHSVKLAQVTLGEVNQVQTFPAKLVVNTDRQAHFLPSFTGRVESVYVELG